MQLHTTGENWRLTSWGLDQSDDMTHGIVTFYSGNRGVIPSAAGLGKAF